MLAYIKTLPPQDKASALSIAAQVDLAKGKSAAAIPKFNQASQYSIDAGQFTTAADLMTSSAEVSLKISKPRDAKESLTKAIDLYQNAKDKSGEAESVYKLIRVENALGDKAASTSTLQQYLMLEPQGLHAAEAKELLNATQTFGPKSNAKAK